MNRTLTYHGLLLLLSVFFATFGCNVIGADSGEASAQEVNNINPEDLEVIHEVNYDIDKVFSSNNRLAFNSVQIINDQQRQEFSREVEILNDNGEIIFDREVDRMRDIVLSGKGRSAIIRSHAKTERMMTQKGVDEDGEIMWEEDLDMNLGLNELQISDNDKYAITHGKPYTGEGGSFMVVDMSNGDMELPYSDIDYSNYIAGFIGNDKALVILTSRKRDSEMKVSRPDKFYISIYNLATNTIEYMEDYGDEYDVSLFSEEWNEIYHHNNSSFFPFVKDDEPRSRNDAVSIMSYDHEKNSIDIIHKSEYRFHDMFILNNNLYIYDHEFGGDRIQYSIYNLLNSDDYQIIESDSQFDGQHPRHFEVYEEGGNTYILHKAKDTGATYNLRFTNNSLVNEINMANGTELFKYKLNGDIYYFDNENNNLMKKR